MYRKAEITKRMYVINFCVALCLVIVIVISVMQKGKVNDIEVVIRSIQVFENEPHVKSAFPALLCT